MRGAASRGQGRFPVFAGQPRRIRAGFSVFAGRLRGVRGGFAETEREFKFSRTGGDPGPPTGAAVVFFQGILGRSGPEKDNLHRNCGRTWFPARYQMYSPLAKLWALVPWQGPS